MSDQLSLRIKPGDEQAFELLLRKFYARLNGYAKKFLNHPDVGHEVVQGSFKKILEGREVLDLEESLNAYLFKITQNISINKLRRKLLESKYNEILFINCLNQSNL